MTDRISPHDAILPTIPERGVVNPLPKGVLESTPFKNNVNRAGSSSEQKSHPVIDRTVSSRKIRTKFGK